MRHINIYIIRVQTKPISVFIQYFRIKFNEDNLSNVCHASAHNVHENYNLLHSAVVLDLHGKHFQYDIACWRSWMYTFGHAYIRCIRKSCSVISYKYLNEMKTFWLWLLMLAFFCCCWYVLFNLYYKYWEYVRYWFFLFNS